MLSDRKKDTTIDKRFQKNTLKQTANKYLSNAHNGFSETQKAAFALVMCINYTPEELYARQSQRIIY